MQLNMKILRMQCRKLNFLVDLPLLDVFCQKTRSLKSDLTTIWKFGMLKDISISQNMIPIVN